MPFSSIQSENADAVVFFIQGILNDIGFRNISIIITNNASNMNSAWKNLTDDKDKCGNFKHLLFMSCACHMIHNYIKEVSGDEVFNSVLTWWKAI